jgi:hypothetical protein
MSLKWAGVPDRCSHGIYEDEHCDKCEIEQLQAKINRLIEACSLFRYASIQRHNGHWDPTMQRGSGCPECLRADKLREKGDAIMEADPIKLS